MMRFIRILVERVVERIIETVGKTTVMRFIWISVKTVVERVRKGFLMKFT
jgi:hypothetical protein